MPSFYEQNACLLLCVKANILIYKYHISFVEKVGACIISFLCPFFHHSMIILLVNVCHSYVNNY